MTPEEKEISRFDAKENITKPQIMMVNSFRGSFKELATRILAYTPSCADRSAAIRYLRLAQMQVNAAICHDWIEEKKENDTKA